MRSLKVKAVLLLLTGVLALALVWMLAQGSSEAQQGSMQYCPQPGKWAISVWTGDQGTDSSQALATCGPGAVEAAYYLEPQTQQWLRWFAGRPEVSNLSTLDEVQGVIALGGATAAAGIAGGGSLGAAQAGQVVNCPQAGQWSIAVWDGASGSDVQTALAKCGEGAVTAAYYLDPGTQNWLRWFAGRPEVSSLKTLDEHQGVLALSGACAAGEFSLDRIAQANQALQRYHMRLEFDPGVWWEGEMDLAEGRQYVQLGATGEDSPIAEIFWADEEGYGRPLESGIWSSISGEPFADYLGSALAMLQGGKIVSTREVGCSWLVDVQLDSFPPLDDPEGFIRTVFGEPQNAQESEFRDRGVELAGSLEMDFQVSISRGDSLIRGLTVRARAQEIEGELRATFGPSQMAIPPLPEEARQLADPENPLPPAMLLFSLPGIGGWSENANHAPWAQRAIKLIEQKDTTGEYTEVYSAPLAPPWHFDEFPLPGAFPPNVDPKTFDPYPEPHKDHPVVLGATYEDSHDPYNDPASRLNFYNTWFLTDHKFQDDNNYYYDQSGLYRAFFHFGAGDLGLKNADYFDFWGPVPARPKPDDRFCSARDWGYSRSNCGGMNGFTWEEAIQQYNRYDFQGKRNAYLMLGHVVHLLQDQGEPDHARLLEHGCSSFTQEGLFTKTSEKKAWGLADLCDLYGAVGAGAGCVEGAIIGGAAGAAGGFGVGAVAGAAIGCGIGAVLGWLNFWGGCELNEDPSQMGYERVVREFWRLERVQHEENGEQVLENGDIEREADYSDFFAEMAAFSEQAANQCDQGYGYRCLAGFADGNALGCSALPIPTDGTIPNLFPVITPPYYEDYLRLTDRLVPKIITLSAGLIEYFYEIVNHPPIAEEVAIVQCVEGLIGIPHQAKPAGFASFPDDPSCELRYDAEWGDVYGMEHGVGKRMLHQTAQQQDLAVGGLGIVPLPQATRYPAYVFIRFGSGVPPETPGVEMAEAQLKLKGTISCTREDIDEEEVSLERDQDSSGYYYYWGRFVPRNPCETGYELQLLIEGKDRSAHLAQRPHPGDEIDAEPGTPAVVDYTKPDQHYPWLAYELGPDGSHSIFVAGADQRPTVTITNPAVEPPQLTTVIASYDDTLELYYADVQLEGGATDPEDGTLSGPSLVWTTDRDDLQGPTLGEGTSLTARLYAKDVCKGETHEVTLTGTDSAGNSVSDSVLIYIYSVC